MSYTSIPPKIQWQIWLQAGGRCEYRGCNEPLWKDNLTLAKMNRAYLAHIIADSPNGPRGDPVLSDALKADPSNIMLLCDAHHRLIDKVMISEHPPELLRNYKREHENRIELLTALHSNIHTEILLFGTRIGNRQGLVNFQEACEAVMPARYPANEKGIRIDLSEIELNEKDPEYWEVIPKHIDRVLDRYLSDGKGPTGDEINHFSVFALAPIGALIYLGKKLGDIRPADVYQRHRHPATWKWLDFEDKSFEYLTGYPSSDQIIYDAPIAVNLSLSNPIRNEDIAKYFGRAVNIYSVSLAHPHLDFLKAQEQLVLFNSAWHKLMPTIMKSHGSNCEVHLFPAVPNAVAVEIGRSLIEKVAPRFVVHDAQDGTFFQTITIK